MMMAKKGSLLRSGVFDKPYHFGMTNQILFVCLFVPEIACAEKGLICDLNALF